MEDQGEAAAANNLTLIATSAVQGSVARRCRSQAESETFLLTDDINLGSRVDDKVEFARGAGHHTGTGQHVHADNEERPHAANDGVQVRLTGLSNGEDSSVFAGVSGVKETSSGSLNCSFQKGKRQERRLGAGDDKPIGCDERRRAW